MADQLEAMFLVKRVGALVSTRPPSFLLSLLTFKMSSHKFAKEGATCPKMTLKEVEKMRKKWRLY